MSALLALALAALVAGVVVLGRALGRVGPLWLRPAHAPLWLVSGLVVALAAALVNVVMPAPAEALARALHVAADGPGARLTHLALGLASLIMIAPVSRISFAIVRRRRLDRAPVPAWFRLLGVGPDGRPLAALRVRLFVPALILALAAAAAGALAPRGLDTTLWAGLVALLTGAALAVAPWPRASEVSASAPARPAEAAPEAPDPLPELLARLARDGVTVRAERRPAVAGAAPYPARLVAAGRDHDVIASAPTGAGKTGAALELTREAALAGREVLWVSPTRATADEAMRRFEGAPEAVLLPPLDALTPLELERRAADPHAHLRFDHVVIDDADLLSGPELAALRRDLTTLAPGARLLVLGVGPEVAALARPFVGVGAELVVPAPHEPLPTAAVERWVVARAPDALPPMPSGTTGPRTIVQVLGPANAHRFLASPPRYPDTTRERLALTPRAARLRALAPPCPRPLVPARPAPLEVDAPVAQGTPVRTTRVRLARIAARARHRFRGPAELELLEARVEIRRATGGERVHDADHRRAHTRLGEAPEAPAVVVDARVVVLPTTDPVVLHTLTHVVGDLLPWFFRDADRLIGVTSAGPAELGLATGALVVHDLAHEGAGAGSVAGIAERDWEALLSAARALLAECDCAAHCARCCESTRCTLTPHNVELDRHRAVALLDALLVSRAVAPPSERKVA
ncbi:MAG: hypothetical protein IT385_12200 [Deltaproteobacteria bacterium]|nr:hypothetical protein [Deltaproteobacteria bacterium]